MATVGNKEIADIFEHTKKLMDIALGEDYPDEDPEANARLSIQIAEMHMHVCEYMLANAKLSNYKATLLNDTIRKIKGYIQCMRAFLNGEEEEEDEDDPALTEENIQKFVSSYFLNKEETKLITKILRGKMNGEEVKLTPRQVEVVKKARAKMDMQDNIDKMCGHKP